MRADENKKTISKYWLSESQKEELKKRYIEYKSGKLFLHSWQSVHDEIKSNYK